MMSPSSPDVLSYLSSQAGWERHIRSGDFWKNQNFKFQTVEKYLNSLNRTACSTVQYISIEGRYVTVINRDIRMYCDRFVGPSHTAYGWSPCFIRIIHARIQNWTVCYNGTHTHACSELSYWIAMWNASGVHKTLSLHLPGKRVRNSRGGR